MSMTKKHNLYPAFIVLAIICFIIFLAWAAMRAADSGPEVTDADYYSKGLRYTSTILEKKAASSLGWHVSTKLAGRTLFFSLQDKEGQPVRSAKGTLAIYLPDSDGAIKFPLQETKTGVYMLKLRENLSGEISARLEFEQDGARLNRQLLLNL